MFHPTLDPQLVGEVIGVNADKTTIQVYENTTGLRSGEQVIPTGGPLCATLGPGILDNIGRTHLSAIERGERKPTLETLYRIACALDVPMSALVLDMEAEMIRRQG